MSLNLVSLSLGFHQEYPTLSASSCGSGRQIPFRYNCKKQYIFNECYKFRKLNQVRHVCQLLKQKASHNWIVSEIMHKLELSEIDSTVMVAFLKTPWLFFSWQRTRIEEGHQTTTLILKEMKASRVMSIVQNENCSILGIDHFWNWWAFIFAALNEYFTLHLVCLCLLLFLKKYSTWKEFCESLVVLLHKNFLSKSNSHKM